MTSKVKGVWAIDIGSNALKALQMWGGSEGIEVVDFAYLEHPKNLASGEVKLAEKEQIISDTLTKFLEEKDLSKCDVAISIAGQNSFARFIKLPPVETKKIPEIVQFEAVQQIPFDINEVEWDWQLMEIPDSPDKEVGLFAIKNELISEVMDHFTKENLRVTCVQIAPMSLYNYASYDLAEIKTDPKKAVIILDVGTENTTLVICTRDTVWQRSISIGGNTFTEAIADTFKKNFPTAEKLKRTAPMSKYMRQIYTAMKSVYSDFGSEIQRSLGFYSSSPQGRNKTFTKMVAIGGGMKLQGLSKYLTQTLGVTVVKPDTFERLAISPDISTAKFHEHVSDFGIPYGLGVQLLEEAKITTNMLPRKIARAMAWTRKAKIFTIAASVLLLVMLLGIGRAYNDYNRYNGLKGVRSTIQSVIRDAQQVKSNISKQENRKQPLEEKIKKYMDQFGYRNIVPLFTETVLKCLPNKENNPQQADVYDAFESGNVQALLKTPRDERMQLFVTRFAIEYTPDIETADFPQDKSKSRTSFQPQRTAVPMVVPGSGIGGIGGMPGGMGSMPGGVGQQAQEKPKSGFTVLIEGYSPYKKISELLDPPNVQDNPSQWGLVTRFENLNKLFKGIPFTLYKRHDIKHFDVKTDFVDLDSKDKPDGIGIQKEMERVPKEATRKKTAGMMMGGGFAGMSAARDEYVTTEKVLVDPMTNEEISKTYDYITQRDIDANPDLTDKDLGRIRHNELTGEKQFIERDQWFRIKAKFVWKDAPQPPASQGAVGGPGGMGLMNEWE